MPHSPDDEDAECGRDDRHLPRWHAPPRPRDITSPQPAPERAPALPEPERPPAPTARLRARLALPLLVLALLLVAALVLRPAPRDETMRPAPSPPTVVPTVRALATVALPPGATTIGCLGVFTLDASAATPAVGRDAAESTARDGYDLPLRLGRLGTLADARLVTLGYLPAPFGAPVIQATQAAAITGRLAWVLAFSMTPALDVPVAPAGPIGASVAYAAYFLVDAATGTIIQSCEGREGRAGTSSGSAPAVPADGDRRQSIESARSAVDFPVRAATWLPFVPAERFARVSQLPEGQAEVVADYFAASGAASGARVRLISTTHAPLLATPTLTGTTVPLAAGQAARFDDLGVLQVLTWHDGTVWYQVVAARQQGGGASYTAEELVRVADGAH